MDSVASRRLRKPPTSQYSPLVIKDTGAQQRCRKLSYETENLANSSPNRTVFRHKSHSINCDDDDDRSWESSSKALFSNSPSITPASQPIPEHGTDAELNRSPLSHGVSELSSSSARGTSVSSNTPPSLLDNSNSSLGPSSQAATVFLMSGTLRSQASQVEAAPVRPDSLASAAITFQYEGKNTKSSAPVGSFVHFSTIPQLDAKRFPCEDLLHRGSSGSVNVAGGLGNSTSDSSRSPSTATTATLNLTSQGAKKVRGFQSVSQQLSGLFEKRRLLAQPGSAVKASVAAFSHGGKKISRISGGTLEYSRLSSVDGHEGLVNDDAVGSSANATAILTPTRTSSATLINSIAADVPLRALHLGLPALSLEQTKNAATTAASSPSAESGQAAASFALRRRQLSISPSTAINTVSSALMIVGSVGFWYSCSMLLTAVNKQLFDSLNFDYPILVTFVHFAAISIGTHLAYLLCSSCFGDYPRIGHTNYLKFIIPIGFCGACEIALSNLAYAMLSISTMTVIKSSLVVVTYFLSIAADLEKFNAKLFAVVLFIMVSITVTVPGMEIKNGVGVMLLCFAVLIAATRWVIVHHQLQKYKFTPLQLVLATQPFSTVFIAVPALAVDARRLLEDLKSGEKVVPMFTAAWLVSVAVVLAFAVIFAEYRLVMITSSLSLTVAGVGKEIATIVMSAYGFHEDLHWKTLAGIGCSILGVVAYAKVRFDMGHSRTFTGGGSAAVGAGETAKGSEGSSKIFYGSTAQKDEHELESFNGEC